MTRKKIITAGLVLILLIIIAAFSALSIVQAKTVANVEKASVLETSPNSVSLSWKRISSADGYYIYLSPAGENNFERAGTVKEGKTEQFTVEKLDQATEYDFYITAFKTARRTWKARSMKRFPPVPFRASKT